MSAGEARRPVLAALALAATAVLATACVTPTQRREDSLLREARTFNDDLRWGRYEQMASSLVDEEARMLLARAGALGDELKIADFEVTSITFAPGSEAATVLVKLEWYSNRSTTLHATTLDQRWEQRNGKWLVVKQRRLRGDKFPLVPEPATPPSP